MVYMEGLHGKIIQILLNTKYNEMNIVNYFLFTTLST